jgi:hypothetical protein
MVVYQLAAGGPQYIVDAGRRNSIALVLWANADWEIRIQAYDAMGNASPLSSPVRVKMNNTTNQTFLPLLNH